MSRRAARLAFSAIVCTALAGFTSVHAEGADGAGTAYVRMDFGYTLDYSASFSQAEVNKSGGGFASEEIGDAANAGIGLGWRLADYLRLDVTAEHRFNARVNATDFVQRRLTGPDGVLTASTAYTGNASAWAGLVNAYVDLPKWGRITPYLGAGIGLAHNRFSTFSTASSGSFRDDATGSVITQTSTGSAGSHAENALAWALMAGLSFDLDPTAKLDIGYRYLHLGSDVAASTRIIDCLCGVEGSPLEANDLNAHEVRIGMRWALDPVEPRESHAPLK